MQQVYVLAICLPFIPEGFFLLHRKFINSFDIRAYRGPGGARLSIHLEHLLLFMQRQGTYMFFIFKRENFISIGPSGGFNP